MAERDLVRGCGLLTDGSTISLEAEMLERADVERIHRTAVDVGLASPERRSLLLAWIPASVVAALPNTAISPSEQLRADLTALLEVERRGQPGLSLWLENAERLTDYLPGIPAVFAAARRTLLQERRPSPPPQTPTEPPAATPAPATSPLPALEIQFLAAQPRTAVGLRVGGELTEIQRRLEAGVFRERLKLGGVRMATQARDVREVLARSEAGIVHFSGHGRPGGVLVFEDAVGGSQDILASGFVRLIRLINSDRAPASQVRLVVLNACHSHDLATALVTRPAAVPCAIGTTAAVADEASIAFAEGFYSALTEGRSVQYAFDAGRLQVSFLDPRFHRYEEMFRLAVADGIDPKAHFVLPG